MVMGLPVYGRTFTFDGSLEKLPQFRSKAIYVNKVRLWGGPNGTIVDESGNLPYAQVRKQI
jgi:hypothetical protein